MSPGATFERIVRAAVRRPGPVVALLVALAVGGGVLALGLRPDTGSDTLVGRSSPSFKASERYHQRFGDDAVYVLVSSHDRQWGLSNLVLTPDIGRLLGLEGCISGNVPAGVTPRGGPNGPCAQFGRHHWVQVVYGPGTFINEAAGQIQDQFKAQQADEASRERRAARAAARLAAARGLSPAEQAHLANEARGLVRAQFVRDTLQLALNYGIRSLPRLNDPGFVSTLVFDPARRLPHQCPNETGQVPKARFAYLFPTACSALVQVRLRPDLSQNDRRHAIALIRAATRMPDWRLRNGGRYTVTGAPVVVSDLTTTITHSIVTLLVVALLAMAAILALVFRTRMRLLPLGVGLGASALTFGGLALVGGSLTMASIAVLPVLIGLAVDYAIQLQARFAELRERDSLEPREAAARAARLGAPTIGAACLATMAGFLVLQLSPVPMVRGFGLLLVAGIALAFACALTAGFAVLAASGRPVPARARPLAEALGRSWRGAVELVEWGYRTLRGPVRPDSRPARWARTARARGLAAWQRALREAMQRPGRVLAIGAVLAVAGLIADTQTKVVSDVQRLVPGDLPALRNLNTLQRATGVGGEIDVTVQARDLSDPKVLSWMSGYQAALLRRYGYSSTRGCGAAKLCPALSLPDLFRASGAANSQSDIRALLASVPTYFSQAVITPDRRVANMAFGIRLMPLDEQQRVIDDMRAHLNPPAGVKAELAGLPVLAAEANQRVAARWRRLLTLVAGLAAVALALLAIYRRPRRALVPLIPIALASGWSALVLFALRVPLNPMSVTLGALVIAISTEFSVLLSERYRQERAAGLAPEPALERTYRSTGAAVRASGLTAIGGFAVLVFSDIRMLRDFGFVTVIDLAVSLAGVLVVLPAALMLAETGELAEAPARALRRVRRLLPGEGRTSTAA